MADPACKCGQEPRPGQPDGFIVKLGDLYGYTPSNNNEWQSLVRDAGYIAQRFPNEGWDDPGKIIYMNTTKNFCETSDPANMGQDSPYSRDPSLAIRLKTHLYNHWMRACRCKSCDPKFEGGQCGINYLVTYKITNRATNLKTGQLVAGGFDQLVQQAVFPGAIKYFGRLKVDGNGSKRLEVGCQNPQTMEWQLINIISNVDWGVDYGFEALSCQVLSVVPQNPGELDNCGNSEPEPEPDPFPPGGTPVLVPSDEIPPPPDKDPTVTLPKPPMPEPTAPTTVKTCFCAPDGTSQFINTSINVPESEATIWAYAFNEIAEIRASQCKLTRWVERIYNILDGDSWFPDAATRTPNRDFNAESVVRQYGAFMKLGDQCPQPEPTKVFSLIGMLNAMSAVDYYRNGFNNYPIKVPTSLIDYPGQEAERSLNSEAILWDWFIHQVDNLIGRFPIEIEIEDEDPLTEGKQYKKVEFPNIAETLAELYGLGLINGTNTSISVSFLMRLASEVMATKNAALIAQDYAKANASWLGYKGNPAERNVPYAFDPRQSDDMASLLKESVGTIIGWQEEDNDTLISYLQRLMFSAAIIKSVFFRNKKQLNELQKELSSILDKSTGDDEAAWKKFIELINSPESTFNRGDNPQPKIDKEPTKPGS
ncbi:hypothetical protein [Pantanalinema sp. GBBB05]|uniref:hypothetical protein n=1 Tax=Pantanalinema sp. GBBB05 TaxID=2604139 RepID=UPI003D81BE0E